MVVAAVVALVWRVSTQGAARRMLAGAARPLGLRMQGSLVPGELSAGGTIDGLRVDVNYRDTQTQPKEGEPWPSPTARCQVRIQLTAPLPDGLALRSMTVGQHVLQAFGAQDIEVGDARIDAALRIAGRDESAIRELLQDGELRALLLSLAEHHETTVELSGSELRLLRSGHSAMDPRPLIDRGVDLARMLARASQRPWHRFASARGLRVLDADSKGERILEGDFGGTDVRVRLKPQQPDQPVSTTIHARIDPPLPGGLRMRGKEQGERSSGASTGNPILDTAVQLHCTDLDVARRILGEPAVTPPLMEVLHGHADARVFPAGVAVSLEGWDPDAIDTALRAAADLAVALQNAAGNAQPTDG